MAVAIPIELFLNICKFLNAQTYFCLATSCRRLYALLPKYPLLDLNDYKKYETFVKSHQLSEFKFQLQPASCDAAAFEYLCYWSYRLPQLVRHGHHFLNALPRCKIDLSLHNHFFVRAACELGDASLVSRLLDIPAVDPSALSCEALAKAARNGHYDVVVRLLQDARIDPRVSNNYAIHIAAERGHTKIVEALLEDTRCDPASDDQRAIRFASWHGHASVVAALLTHPRVDPGAEESFALRMAAKEGHTEVVRLLVHDPRVDPTLLGHAALRSAATNGFVEIVGLLLESPLVALDLKEPRNHEINWVAAIYHNRVRELLSEKDFDVSAMDHFAIRMASRAGLLDVVELLLDESSADPTVMNFDPLRLAARHGHWDVVDRLLCDPRCTPPDVLSIVSTASLEIRSLWDRRGIRNGQLV
ncbi:hypothetical protein HDU91_002336 [Kappamyces sp. JEL0680]|nr:hypothetical protein HDU91_002336 [Kappamyces sp. JEL0680]